MLFGIIMNVVLPMFGVDLGNMGVLIVFAALFGFGGSLISLLASKWIAKRFTGARVIEQPRNEAERWLVATVHRQADAAGIVFVLDMVFGLFASMIAMWFSRHREFRADIGGATLAGKDKMIAALQRLGQNHGVSTLPKQVEAFGISGAMAHGFRKLLMSHPPLEQRIAALRNARPDEGAIRQGVMA